MHYEDLEVEEGEELQHFGELLFLALFHYVHGYGVYGAYGCEYSPVDTF